MTPFVVPKGIIDPILGTIIAKSHTKKQWRFFKLTREIVVLNLPRILEAAENICQVNIVLTRKSYRPIPCYVCHDTSGIFFLLNSVKFPY